MVPQGSALGPFEPPDAVGALVPAEAAIVGGAHEVREGLADGEAQLVSIEGTREEGRDQLGRRARCRARAHHLVEPLGVVRRELIKTRVKPVKRQVVGGQDEAGGWYDLL